MTTSTITTKFHNPSWARRRGWQRASHLYAETKQWLIDGWESGELVQSITSAGIENGLYAVIQSQAIREAKSEYSKDGAVQYNNSIPFGINNQNWEVDQTENGTVVIGFPCISRWWYTPIAVYDEIEDVLQQLLAGELKKSLLQVYRRGSEWYCSFTVTQEKPLEGKTPVGVDIGERHILAAVAPTEDESLLVSGREAKYLRRKYRSLRESLQEAGALRALNRVGKKEHRRMTTLNHTLSRRLVEFTAQFEDPVLRIENLDGIQERCPWPGVHSWPFGQLQRFIIYKAAVEGIPVEKVDPSYTSQRCSACGATGNRSADHFSCPNCGRGRHADLNAAENIASRKGEPCTT
ncbi:transposase [Haloarchaeobius amylolyticus]|uniref:transposase n=1 Tax=Haloarchaeobius amylolyticus TaxID=1198296 RepID=UPI002271F41B|nr:transposase [Haloarchaeobius amylolyticus]